MIRTADNSSPLRFAALLLFFCLAVSSAQQRLTLPLNDNWRAQRVEGSQSLPTGRWQTASLPHVFASRGYRSAWYEKEFQAPALPAVAVCGRWRICSPASARRSP